jgi:hypothetical protein
MVFVAAFTHHCPNLKVAKMPFSRGMGKSTMTHPDNGTPFGAKNK